MEAAKVVTGGVMLIFEGSDSGYQRYHGGCQAAIDMVVSRIKDLVRN